MKRYAANLLYCSPDNLLRNGVVEINEQTGEVTAVFSLDDEGDEVQSAIFFNGILLPFKPFFTSEECDSDIFLLLKKQFLKNISCDISCRKKINLWLLEGDSLFVDRIPGKNRKVTPLFVKE
jgi:hypothetical protein